MSSSDLSNRPPDFDTYWNAVDADLARIPASPEVEAVPLRSTDFSTTYELRLTSIGPYRIFGWYSRPHGDGPFPGLLHTPGYGSVVTPAPYDDRQRYAVLNIVHRGQRLANRPFAARYPGLLTEGIDAPATYIYHVIAADIIRGAEFLRSQPEVDPGRVGVVGSDLAVIAAARRPGFATLQVSDLIFYRLMEARRRSEAYPIEEISDYLRTYPDREVAVARTLAYFDPRHHAPRVDAAVTIKTGAAGSLAGPDWLSPLIEAFPGPVHPYAATNEGGIDRDALDAIMSGHLGAVPKPRVWTIAEI